MPRVVGRRRGRDSGVAAYPKPGRLHNARYAKVEERTGPASAGLRNGHYVKAAHVIPTVAAGRPGLAPSRGTRMGNEGRSATGAERSGAKRLETAGRSRACGYDERRPEAAERRTLERPPGGRREEGSRVTRIDPALDVNYGPRKPVFSSYGHSNR